MKSHLSVFWFVVCTLAALLTGCASHETHRDVEYPGVEQHDTYTKNGIGSTFQKSSITSTIPMGGQFGGMPYGMPGQLAYPSAPPTVYISPVPVVTDGARAMEQIGGGAVTLVPESGGYATTKQLGTVVRKVDQLNRRVGQVETVNGK